MNRIAIWAAAALLAFSATAAAADRLVVATDTAFVPFEFKCRTANMSASTSTCGTAIAEEIELEFDLQPMDFNGIIPGAADQAGRRGARRHHHSDERKSSTFRTAITTAAFC
jgi:ABC-type amino acid transport substrate-binding protein